MSIKSSIFKELYPNHNNLESSEWFGNFRNGQLRSIPAKIQNMKALRVLDLSHNEILSLLLEESSDSDLQAGTSPNTPLNRSWNSTLNTSLNTLFSSSLRFPSHSLSVGNAGRDKMTTQPKSPTRDVHTSQGNGNALSSHSIESPNSSIHTSNKFPLSPMHSLSDAHEQELPNDNVQEKIEMPQNQSDQSPKSQLFSNTLTSKKSSKHYNLKLPHLEKLYLHDNSITAIEGLENFQFLQILNLNNNTINVIRNIERCINLRVLDLSENQISQLDSADVFKSLHNLEYLDISSNMLKEIPNLTWNRKLIYFNISNNFISDNMWRFIDTSLPLESLRELDLHKNELHSFTSFTTMRRMSNLHTLNVLDNPFWEKASFMGIDLLPLFLYMLPQLKMFVQEPLEFNGDSLGPPEDVIQDMIISTHVKREQLIPILKQFPLEQMIRDTSESSILNLLQSIQKGKVYQGDEHNGAPFLNGDSVYKPVPEFSSTLISRKNMYSVNRTHATSAGNSKPLSKSSRRIILPDVDTELSSNWKAADNSTIDAETSPLQEETEIHSPNISCILPSKQHHQDIRMQRKNLLPSPGGMESPQSSRNLDFGKSDPIRFTGFDKNMTFQPVDYTIPTLSQSATPVHFSQPGHHSHKLSTPINNNIAVESLSTKSQITHSATQETSSNGQLPKIFVPEWKIEVNRLQRHLREVKEQCNHLSLLERKEKSQAACIIQRNVRAFLSRRRYGSDIQAIRQRIHMKRMIYFRKKYLTWKSLISSPRVRKYEKDITNLAAVRIQASWRGYSSRKKVRQFFQNESAAIIIQQFWRKYKARTNKFYKLQLQLQEEIATREKLQEAIKYLWSEVAELRKWKESQTQTQSL